jgi:hypothetical protein
MRLINSLRVVLKFKVFSLILCALFLYAPSVLAQEIVITKTTPSAKPPNIKAEGTFEKVNPTNGRLELSIDKGKTWTEYGMVVLSSSLEKGHGRPKR